MKQHALPFLAAIFGIEDATLRIRSVGVPERRDKDFLRVARIDENPRNLARIVEANVRPAFAAIGGLIHAVAVGNGRTHVRLTTAHIDDLRIGGGDGDGTDGRDGLRIKNRIPGAAGIIRAPHAAAHRAEVENLGLAPDAGDRQGSAAAKRSNRAPAELLKQFRVEVRGRVRQSRALSYTKGCGYDCANGEHTSDRFHDAALPQWRRTPAKER